VVGVRLLEGQGLASRFLRLCWPSVIAPGDTFAMLHRQGVGHRSKAFSDRLRIEHSQPMRTRLAGGACAGHHGLAAASTKLVHHCRNGRTVYSFLHVPRALVVAGPPPKQAMW